MKPTLQILTGDRSGEKVVLSSHKTYVFGRDQGLDIQLPEKKISRRHANLDWDGKRLVLEDLKSLNGTFVNGNLIANATELKDKDRFQIGSYLIEVSMSQKASVAEVETNAVEILEGHEFDEPSLIPEPLEYSEPPSTATGASISGKLSEVSLADLLQMLSATKKSGRLVIAAKKKEVESTPPLGVPSLYIRGGDLVGAEIRDLKNEEAFYEILKWQNGYFSLFPNVRFDLQSTIELSLEALLLEGFRRLDEEKTATIQFQPDTSFEVCMDEPLTNLEPDELRIFQLIWKKKKLSSVWDSSHLDQKSTDVIIRKLFRSGYIRKH